MYMIVWGKSWVFLGIPRHPPSSAHDLKEQRNTYLQWFSLADEGLVHDPSHPLSNSKFSLPMNECC